MSPFFPSDRATPPESSQVATVEARALAKELESAQKPVLLDVREAWEFAQGSLPGALHLPVAQITADKSSALGLKPDRPIVAFCHHGVRSQRAAQALAQAGYTKVRSLSGGIDAWSQQVDASVGRY